MPRSARKEGFSRRHRFAQRGSFGPVLHGSRKIRGRFAVIHVHPGRPGASRFGVALTRRLLPSAVQRNAVKRIAREAFRRNEAKHKGLDCVVTLREAVTVETASAFRAELEQLLARVG